MDADSDSDQEEFTPLPHPNYAFQLQNQQKTHCDCLIVAFYGASSLFAHSLVTTPVINRLNFSKAKQQSLANVYQQTNGNTFLIFNEEVQPMKEVLFAKFISEAFSFNKCIVLSCESRNKLQKASNACLQSIKTSKWSYKPVCSRFEQGIQGMAADLITFCEINNIPLSCYIGILSEYQLTRQCIQAVFGSLRHKHGFQANIDTTDGIRKYNMKKYSNKIYL